VNAQKLGFGNRVRSFNKPLPACPNEGLALWGLMGLLVSNLTAHRNLEHVNTSCQNARSAHRALDGRYFAGAKLAGVRGSLATLSTTEGLHLEQADTP
jgi:hypothetical protein